MPDDPERNAESEETNPTPRTQLEHLIKRLLPVACCHWRGSGVLEVLTIVGRRLLIFGIGVALVSIVCCLRGVLHGRRGRVLAVALAVRHLAVVRVGFSALSLRHVWRRKEPEGEIRGSKVQSSFLSNYMKRYGDNERSQVSHGRLVKTSTRVMSRVRARRDGGGSRSIRRFVQMCSRVIYDFRYQSK